jgi:hypothetical protein
VLVKQRNREIERGREGERDRKREAKGVGREADLGSTSIYVSL